MSASPAALLARARELARGSLPPAIAAALAALPDELRAAAAASTSPPEQTLLEEAATGAESRRGAIAAAFEAGLLEIFDRKLRPAASAAAAAGPTDLASLTLVDDDAMELEIALGRLVRKTNEELDADGLAGVGARLGELATGKSLEGPANPLGPETALEALKRGCDAAAHAGPVRMALVNHLQPHVALGLRKLHAQLNDMLVAEGVLPRIRHHVQRPAQGRAVARAPSGPGGAGGPGSPGGGTAGHGGGGTAGHGGGGTAGHGGGGTAGHGGGPASGLPGLPPGITISQAMALKDLLPGATGSPIDLRSILGALLEGPATSRRHGARMLANPEGSLYERAMTAPVPADLVAQLSQLQRAGAAAAGGAGAGGGPADLGAVVAALAQAREHPLEQLTGELVAVVFDFVLHDRDLPEAVKDELARLQIVAFKAAVLDRTFFAKRAHPLRELLAAIADAGTDPEIDAAPEGRFVAGLRAIVDEVLASFAEDLAIFAAARERLAALVAELHAERAPEVEALATGLAEAEAGEEIRARAAVEVAKRMAPGAPVFVQRFLTDTWTHAVAEAERNGRTGDESRDARLALVDELVWSVAPKQAADVPRLTGMLPKLVPALGRGMKAVDVPVAAQRAFLDELMQAHTALLQAARAKRPLPPPPPPAAPPPPPASESIAAPELAADSPAILERGAVVEFAAADAGPAVRAKLTWISPKRTVYLFTARGAAARRVSPQELSAALRDARARVVGEGGAVIDRALAAVVGEPGP